MRRPIVSLDSGDPWHLSLVVERVGPDYLCRIHGGDRHIGTLALAQWKAGQVVTDCLVVGRHKECAISIFTAAELCRATHCSVGCVAGIHFDSITKAEIDEICRAARELSVQAARLAKAGVARAAGCTDASKPSMGLQGAGSSPLVPALFAVTSL